MTPQKTEPFVWRIQLSAPLTRGWRWRNLERSGWEPFEWVVVLDCEKYRHSKHMNTCRVCRQKHELPEHAPERYAFRWYPHTPSIKALQQWERWRRHREIKEALDSA